jgi:plastocyanin
MIQNICLMRYFLLIIVFFLLGALVSCGKENVATELNGGQLPTSYISILDSSFSPTVLNISIGASVTFLNSTNTVHTIVSDDSTSFRTSAIAPFQSFYFKKDTIGTIGYHCVEHPNVRGVIVLRP